MATKKKLLQAAAGTAAAGGGGLNVEEVFSTYLYEGNGSTQTITNGIDLDGEGGLVWVKDRSGQDHYIFDTERGVGKKLASNNSDAEFSYPTGLSAFNSDGFSLGGGYGTTGNTLPFASWTFRKAPKFFDVVTYTGNGTSGRTVSHNLGSVPGCIIVKRTDTTGSWRSYHTSLGATKYIDINSTSAAGTSNTSWADTEPTSTEITLGSSVNVNASGGTYVAYLFAHNDGDGEFGPDGDADIIKCGSFTTDSGGNASVDIGFEPQWIIYKRSDGTSNWGMNDNMRGWADTYWNPLYADVSNAESGFAATRSWPTATGFEFEGQLSASANYIYIAIRRGPMAVPESATDVFDVATRGASSGEPNWKSGFVTDFAIIRNVDTADNWQSSARLIQGKSLTPNDTSAESSNSNYAFDYMNGFFSSTSTDSTFYSWMWKRAPNYFDVVAYTGNGTAGRTVSHNLGVAPEMIWVKSRDAAYDWRVYHSSTGATKSLELNNTVAAAANSYIWNDTAPTDSVFSLGTHTNVNKSGDDYIAYLFASLDGVSKVGSFSHTVGSNTDVDCGFSSGARFVLIKRTDNVGHWITLDTERGIVAGNDAWLNLNTTGAENTSYDFIDPLSSGFTVDGSGLIATGTYIFYAIA